MAGKKRPAGGRAGDSGLDARHGHDSIAPGITAEAQRQRLIAALKRGPVDTVTAYRKLDILHVPRRVFELRQAGHDIRTHWVWRFTEAGVKHRVGRYELAGRAA